MTKAAALSRICLTCLAFAQGASADWKEDSGWSQLAGELGSAMPAGAGVAVLQAEANSVASPPDYLVQAGGPAPFAGAGAYAGKTFHPQSGVGTAFGHAASVASHFYANDSGAAPGITQIHAFTAVDYMVNRIFATGGPAVLAGRVHNHSWVGNFADPAHDAAATRRLDFMIARDRAVVVAGLRNDSAMAGLLANTYHGITVGVRSGSHSLGGSNRDGAGRMKPDLVVNVGLTSHAAPVVSGFAAMLIEQALSTADADADRPEVVKALLLAGASKDALPGWRRLTQAKPYDERFGAGEANIRHAWQILDAGRAPASAEIEARPRGWDYRVWNGASCWYFFSIPPGALARTFSAALTWHRAIDLQADAALLANLDLRLHPAENFSLEGQPVAQSVSAMDNVEHLFLRHLPAGQYALEVSGAGQAAAYALAWRAELGGGPSLALRCESPTIWHLDAADLDPWVTYTIESRQLGHPDGAWESQATFRTSDATPSFTHTRPLTPAPQPGRLYRLRWNSVR